MYIEDNFLYFNAIPKFYNHVIDDYKHIYTVINPDNNIELDSNTIEDKNSINHIRIYKWIDKLNVINDDTYISVLRFTNTRYLKFDTHFYLNFDYMLNSILYNFRQDNPFITKEKLLNNSFINYDFISYITLNYSKYFYILLKFDLNNIKLTLNSIIPTIEEVIKVIDYILEPYSIITVHEYNSYHTVHNALIQFYTNLYKSKYSIVYKIQGYTLLDLNIKA